MKWEWNGSEHETRESVEAFIAKDIEKELHPDTISNVYANHGEKIYEVHVRVRVILVPV